MAETTSRRLHVGVVGAGHWAREAHIPGFQRCPEVELIALCDVDRRRAEQVAGDANIPHVYNTATEMVANHQLDIVSVVTPDDCHLSDAGAAIAAGAHVLCEKPLAVTLADAKILATAAHTAGVKTKLGFTMRYAPAMIQLQNLVASGAIGAPRLLQMFLQNGQFLDPATPFHWKMDRDRAGGGAIVEYGIHGLDLARWVMGEATRVCAIGRTWVAERQLADATGSARVNVDDSTAWLMEFASGAIGVCHAGWATVGRPPGLEFRVFGDQGAISCTLWDDLPGSQRLDIAGADGHFRPAKIQLALALPGEADAPWWRAWPAALIRHFVDEIQSTTNVSPTFDDGVRAQGLLDAIVRSMREGRWMVVPL